MHCSVGEAGRSAGRLRPPSSGNPGAARIPIAHRAKPGGPAWWLALPEILTTYATRVSVGGMNEAGCPCSGAFIFFAPRGEAWSCPVGPESGRDVDESEKTIKRPRQETLHRPRDWPSSSYLAETNALCWEVSNDLICPAARKQLAPQKWNLQSFLQAGAFHGVTHAHFSWAGREGPCVKEI